MEEKYLYTIAIVVIFAGFLFTSVGTYTGRAVRSTYTDADVERLGSLDMGFSSWDGSSGTPGFQGQAESPVERTNCDGYVCCEDSQKGQQRVTDRTNGKYVICAGGKWLPQSCPDYNIAMQRLDGVSCSSREA